MWVDWRILIQSIDNLCQIMLISISNQLQFPKCPSSQWSKVRSKSWTNQASKTNPLSSPPLNQRSQSMNSPWQALESSLETLYSIFSQLNLKWLIRISQTSTVQLKTRRSFRSDLSQPSIQTTSMLMRSIANLSSSSIHQLIFKVSSWTMLKQNLTW